MNGKGSAPRPSAETLKPKCTTTSHRYLPGSLVCQCGARAKMRDHEILVHRGNIPESEQSK